MRQQMDSVYEALREGADFATLARRYSDDEACKNVGGVLPWMPVNKNMQEWIDKLESLERNKISAPFYSPMGIHIVKWIDCRQGVSFEEKREQLLNYLEKNGNCTWKELSAEQKEELEFRVQELQDGLLAAYLSQNINRVMKPGMRMTWNASSSNINQTMPGNCRIIGEQ